MAEQSNAKQIKALICELHDRIAEEEGWEPKTARDYSVVTWAMVQDLRSDVKSLKGLYDRVTRLESNQSVFAGIQAIFTVIAAAIAGYFGVKR